MDSGSREPEFNRGWVAKTVRGLLEPSLNDQKVETIVVCLMAHLFLESQIDGVLYRWLLRDTPAHWDEERRRRASDALLEQVTRLTFAHKYGLIEPFFAACAATEAADIRAINALRNDVVHARRPVPEIAFKGRLLSEEQTAESIFMAAQGAAFQLQKFEEYLEKPHENADRWSRRLAELGEPLF